MRSLFCVLALLLLPLRADPPRLNVQQADTNRVIKLTAAGRSFTFPLAILQQSGDADVADLRVNLGPLTRKDGATGLAPSWALTPDSNKPLTVKRRDFVTLTLTGDLPERTEYIGLLTLRYGDQLDPYTVSLTRSATPALTILEAVDGKLVMPVAGQSIERTLTMQTAEGQPEVADLQVHLDPLSRQDGKPARTAILKVDAGGPGPLAVRPGTLVPLRLTGDNLEPTTYVSNLRLLYQGQTQSISLTLTRAPLQQNVSMDDPGTVAVTRFFIPPLCPNPAEIPVVIRETTGQDTAVYYPRLGTLQLVDQKGQTISVAGEQIELFQRPLTGNLVPITAPSPTDMVKLPGNGEASYVFHVSGLYAGSYRGKIVVAGPDNVAVEKSFTINVRGAFLWALLVVVAGVVLSLMLYTWVRGGRARDLRSADIALDREEITRHYRPPPTDPVYDDLLVRLDRLARRNRFEKDLTQEVVTATRNDVHKRLLIYRQGLQARDKVVDVLATFPTSPAGSTARADFEHELDQLFERLRDALLEPEGTGIGAGADDAPQVVLAVGALYNRIRASALVQPAEDLRRQLDELAQESPEVGAQIDLVRNAVAAIVQRAQQNQFTGLADQLQAARRIYATLRLQQLANLIHRIRDERQAAPNASANAWERVDTRLHDAVRHLGLGQAAVTVDGALAECEAAQDDYLGAAIEHLLVLASPDGRPAALDAAQWQSFLSSAVGLTRPLTDAQRFWQSHEYPAAKQSYGQAREEYQKVLVAVLGHDIDELAAKIQERPPFVKPEDWQQIVTSAPLGEILQHLADLRTKLPLAGETAADRLKKYQLARQEFVALQIQALQSAHARLQAYYQANKGSQEHQDDARWTRLLPTGLTSMGSALGEAQTSLAAYEQAPVKEAAQATLLDAQRAAYRAQTQYLSMLSALKKDQKMSAVGAAQAVQSLSATAQVPPVNAPAAIPQTIAAALSGPGQVQIQDLPVYAPPQNLGAADWDRLIRRRDCITQAIAVVLAAASAMLALWFPNPTFGGMDYLTAFLWGFGAHSATADGFLKVGTSLGLFAEH